MVFCCFFFCFFLFVFFFFFFQAEDGIRDFCLSRGLGDVYKRQIQGIVKIGQRPPHPGLWMMDSMPDTPNGCGPYTSEDATSILVYPTCGAPVSYTHLRAHETGRNLVCRLLLEKKKKKVQKANQRICL